MIKKISLFLLLTLLGISVYIYYSVQSLKSEPLKITTELYEVTPGTGFNRLCKDWQTKGYVESCFKYQVYSKFVPELFHLKAGVYELSGMTVLQAVNKIHRGEQKQFSFTIIAGDTFQNILKKLKSSPYVVYPNDEQKLIEAMQVDGAPEGWLLPETYHYEAYTSASAVLNRAKEKMQSVLQHAWQQRMDALPLNEPYQALILASIIEKETGHAPERATIASVFINRLNRNMRLQTDPTVIYGLGDEFDGDIKRRHLKEHTPYNTYRIKGLPPTPIAMPSAEAIYAATQPKQTPYYYFVSKGNGQHQFSKSLREHNQAVQKYILKSNNDS
ncbi:MULTISPECIES: endolytic transglycosylase MltG [Pseudoalteromonas]|uniref:Endolytic murein transglycosylase n=1 Tax=Pseudoalteromonas amylolytica TaxID=1859457 RepID=A0A1S1MZV0_9GAMM|nr:MULTISPECIES: endolytic transglycosylase MltG [Pseudoalteromonas]MCF6434224.1 endolytic transglycosylase MltG [Pseudoalteromonas sp. MMG022]OHU87876.1 ABC transporter substrate-binding protein [Pseudoalteromonas sp. JW3]OHU91316.1 ABC transporter substrate-binding protein [Pseudoalteromonas amylolytica]